MRLLVVSAIWPHGEHSTRAANIVIYEMLQALAKDKDTKVGLLVVGKVDAIEIGENEKRSIAELKSSGVDILDSIVLPDTYQKRPRWKRLLLPRIIDWYPAVADGSLIAKRVKDWQSDAILIPWSEWLTHACSEIPATKFAYYGNPDPKAARTQLRLRYRSGEMTWMRKKFEEMQVDRFEKIHLRIMRRYDLIGDVAKNDAEYYSKNGHKNAFYIQNIWMKSPAVQIGNEFLKRKSIKIIGNVGKLGSTANTLGLEYLGTEVIPALDVVMQGCPYEVHIIGSGAPHSTSAKALNHPSVVWRGFVDDIDREISECDVFLCVNNATEYKVGHTRYLHAWSLSAPVVAHSDVSLSMPEIQNNVNALLGANGIEIGIKIRTLLSDSELMARIKKAGLDTFNDKFTAATVARAILARLNECMELKAKR